MIRTHKARLAIAAASAAGLLLAILFLCVYAYVSEDAFQQERLLLSSAMASLAGDPKHLEIDEFDEVHPDLTFEIFDEGGRTLKRHGHLHLTPTLGMKLTDGIATFGISREDQILVVGGGWSEKKRNVDQIGWILGILWLPLTLFVGGITWIVARSVFSPLERLTTQASTISGSTLTDRLSTTDRAEFGILASNLNRMLDRIEDTIRREDQFASDAAHELRTPLAILRTQIETTLLQTRSVEEYVASNRTLLGEIDRLTRIVESLLRSARRVPLTAEPIDIEPVIQECLARWQDPFVQSTVFLDSQTMPAIVSILPAEVTVLMDNLLDNALRFSPPHGSVFVSLLQQDAHVLLRIQDEGPGIPESLGDRVFDRFVRSDDGRNRKSGGAGIGLAVCKRIIESRGGRIQVDRGSERGATLVCQLNAINEHSSS